VTNSNTLVEALGGTSSIARKAMLVVGGSALIALGAQVSVPMFPVPMTLQTLAILIVGLTLGSRLGVAAVAAYLVEGAAGLPVFAGGASGAHLLVGPTAGFLFGFLAMAFVTGFAVERGMARGLVGTILAATVASALLYVPGVLWLNAATPLDMNGAVNAGMLPFVIGDLVKSVVAGLIVTGGWAALRAGKN
jgi:biotin transport system substrate-specific component